MTTVDPLRGKRILAVDDDPDVLDIVEDQLVHSRVVKAGNYETASLLIRSETFDLVILDIMGVNGFELLKECRAKGIPAAMLTAHSVTVESVNRALRLGAVSFLPKDELTHLGELVVEILESVQAGKTHWPRLFERMGPFFRDRLGLSWNDLEKPPSPPYMY